MSESKAYFKVRDGKIHLEWTQAMPLWRKVTFKD